MTTVMQTVDVEFAGSSDTIEAQVSFDEEITEAESAVKGFDIDSSDGALSLQRLETTTHIVDSTDAAIEVEVAVDTRSSGEDDASGTISLLVLARQEVSSY